MEDKNESVDQRSRSPHRLLDPKETCMYCRDQTGHVRGAKFSQGQIWLWRTSTVEPRSRSRPLDPKEICIAETKLAVVQSSAKAKVLVEKLNVTSLAHLGEPNHHH